MRARRVGPHSSRTTLSWSLLVPLVVAQVLYWLAALVGSGWLVVLAAAAMGPPVVGLVLRPRIAALTVQVRGPGMAGVGTDVRLHVRVVNGGRRGSDPVRISLHEGHDPLALDVPALAAGAEVEIEATVAVSTRGVADERAELVAFGPFGFLKTQRTVATRPGVLTAAAPSARTLPATRATGGHDGTPSSSHRSGGGVSGIREWRPGDPAHHVHWRSSARRGRLIVLERGDAHTAAACVLAAGDAPGPHWEAVVASATGALLAAQQAGNATWALARAGADDVTRQAVPLLPVPLAGPTQVLAWSALVTPALPDGAELRALVGAVSRTGAELVVIATPGVPPHWWHDLDAACGLVAVHHVRDVRHVRHVRLDP